MPFTFFAHQVPVLPLKLARPRWFDGTALCVGSMAPDLAYPMGSWLSRQSHTAIGILTWSVACTFVVCWAIRTWVASTAFAQLPDLGPLRLHSFRVLTLRRPPWWQTLTGAVIGASLHAFVDGFTHLDRWGARWTGSDDVAVDIPIRGEMALTRVFQYTGHFVGSLIGIALLAYIGRKRLLEAWYGAAAVARVRSFTLDRMQRVLFWSVVALAAPAALVWAEATTGVRAFRVIASLAIATAVACALPWTRPRPRETVESPGAELQVG